MTTPNNEQNYVRTNDSKRTVATYTALIRVAIEESSIETRADVSQEQLTRILTTPPQFFRGSWPTEPPRTEAEMLRNVLLKLRALFDFGPNLPTGSSDEIRIATYAAFPQLQMKDSGKVRYRFHKVTAYIWDDGSTGWRLDISPVGAELPELPFVLSGSDLEWFIQNLVRADLATRLEDLNVSA